MGVKHVLGTVIGVVTIVPLVHSIIANRNPAYVAGTVVASEDNDVLQFAKDDVKDSKQAMKDLANAQKQQAKVDKDATKLQAKIDKKAGEAATEQASADQLEAQAIAAARSGDRKQADKLMKAARKQREKELSAEKDAIKNQDKLEKKFPLLGQDEDGNDLRTNKKAIEAQLKASSSTRIAATESAALAHFEAVRGHDRATEQDLILAPETKGLISVLGPKTPVTSAPPVKSAPPVTIGAPVDVVPVTKPVEPVVKPIEPVAKPVEPVTKPVEPIAKPVEPVARPVEPVAKPLVIDQAAMAAVDRQIATLGTRTLQLGMSGPDVAALQNFLKLEPSGSFDADTKAALKQYQIDNNLVLQDGVVGRETRPMIHKDLRAQALKMAQ